MPLFMPLNARYTGMDMDKLEQEETAATVFSYLIRGLSNGNRPAVKAELMEKMGPIKELYGLIGRRVPALRGHVY